MLPAVPQAPNYAHTSVVVPSCTFLPADTLHVMPCWGTLPATGECLSAAAGNCELQWKQLLDAALLSARSSSPFYISAGCAFILRLPRADRHFLCSVVTPLWLLQQ
jgi:hypothetical protein